ncbi:MAG: PepSY domain-containing protein [Thermomicrobiales bacterium]
MRSKRLLTTIILVAALMIAFGAVSASANGPKASASHPASLFSSIARLVVGIGDNETSVAPGTLDDGKDLLPQAEITLDQAVEAAQGSQTGTLGEVDLEHYQGHLVFNVDIGDHDVKVDASTGKVLAANSDD